MRLFNMKDGKYVRKKSRGEVIRKRRKVEEVQG